MGLNEKKPKNQLLATHGSRMEDAYRQAIQQRTGNGSTGKQASGANDIRDMQQSNEQLFWEGFKKGLGLKEGEEVGQEGIKGGLRNVGFSAQDAAMHTAGLDDPPEPSPSPMPAPPPVEKGHEDMENYEEKLDDYYDAHDAWEEVMLNSLCEAIITEVNSVEDPGLEIRINGDGYQKLKEITGGSYKASVALARYILENYEGNFSDERTALGIATEAYIHDRLYTALRGVDNRDDFAEMLFNQAELLHIIYNNDDNTGLAELMANNMNENIPIFNEWIMNAGAAGYVLDTYFHEYGDYPLYDELRDFLF